MSQSSLFNTENHNDKSNNSKNNTPLAFKIRPTNFVHYFGQEHLFKRFRFIKDHSIKLPSLIIWGPPGTGKTTLAHVIASTHKKELYTFNAVLGGVADLKKMIANALDVKQLLAKDPLIFIDEIHRFNKAQQDALLPYVENGSFTLIGATTQYPQISVNRALLSRMQVLELKKLSQENIFSILERACLESKYPLDHSILKTISELVSGDARVACNYLEMAMNEEITTIQELKNLINLNNSLYDKNGDRHYDVVSAFIKSLRGSDPDSALLWMAVMINGGEDPIFIARRLIVFASEDIGNADPSALSVAIATLHAVKNIGMPEARINLAQACTHLASTVKSNAAYLAIDSALDFVRNNPTIEVPNHLKNNHPDKKDYNYPHSYDGNFIKQNYGSQKKFYYPTENGFEKKIKNRLQNLWK